MTREPRRKSSTGIYHVMFRGINGQRIFEDNEDFDKFLLVRYIHQNPIKSRYSKDITKYRWSSYHEYKEGYRLDDLEAEELIIKAAGVKDPKEIQEFEKEKRDKVIHGLKKSGLSIRQIERLTGVSFGIIRGK